VKSEIVVPIFQKEEVFGEIDIDSHVLSPFTKEDETFLKKIAQMMSRIL
jgi:GAF domain-containing protein